MKTFDKLKENDLLFDEIKELDSLVVKVIDKLLKK